MREICNLCGAPRHTALGCMIDRKCRRCGEYWPAPGSVIAPRIDAQFRGSFPYGQGASLAEIILKTIGEVA